MFEKFIRRTGHLIHCAFIPVVYAEQNDVEITENVFHRIKNTFSANEYGTLSPELVNISSTIQNAVVVGTVTGGVIQSKNQYIHFMEKSDATKYKWHFDAKAAMTSRLVQGGIRGAITWGIKCLAVSTTYSILLNYIPVIRNERGWLEYVSSGLIAGALAGHLFSDRGALGFQPTKLNSPFSYKQLCLIRGIGYGLVLSLLVGLNSNVANGNFQIDDLRKWEKYWKQRRAGIENTSNKSD